MSTPQELIAKTKAASNVEVKTLDGVKRYSFQLLTRKEAVKVFHQSLQAVLTTIAGVSMDELTKGKSLAVDDIARALAQLDFDLVWDLGESLLKFVQIDLQEIDFEDYYGEHPTELYIAIVQGIRVNWPEVFSKVRGLLKGIDLPDISEKEPTE
jgi:hypothetical protein